MSSGDAGLGDINLQFDSFMLEMLQQAAENNGIRSLVGGKDVDFLGSPT